MAAHQRPETAKAKGEAQTQIKGAAPARAAASESDQNHGKGKSQKEEEAREDEYMVGEADNVLELTTIYATKAQAMRAAQAKWDKLQRGVAEFSISLAIGQADYFLKRQSR